MVFGWGRKREAEPPRDAGAREVGLADVPGIVEELGRLRESRAVSEVARLRDSAAPLVEELMDIGAHLEADDLDVGDIDRHLALLVTRGKKQVIGAIRRDVAPLPAVSDIDGARALERQLGQVLKKVGDVLGRQTRVIHIFAKKYAAQLKGGLEVMNASHAEIRRILADHDAGTELAGRILEEVGGIGRTREERAARADRLSRAEEAAAEAAESAASLEAAVRESESSEHYREYQELKASLDALGAGRAQIRSAVEAQFAKISRPLGRYEHGSSLDREQRGVLAQLTSDPSGALLPANRDHIITILESVRRGIASGSISVKDTQRSMQQLTEVVESLDPLISRLESHRGEVASLRSRMEAHDMRGHESLVERLEKNAGQRADLDARIASLRAEIAECDEAVPRAVSAVQEMLRRHSSTQYVVNPGGGGR